MLNKNREVGALGLLTPLEVATRIRDALRTGAPFSLIRLGDGEALTLAQERVLSIAEVRSRGAFLPYAGVEVPDLRARDELVRAIVEASLVGVTQSDAPDFWPLLRAGLLASGLDPASLPLTGALINYELQELGFWGEVLREGRPPVLLVGNRMPELRGILRQAGIRVVGIVAPVAGVKKAAEACRRGTAFPHRLALVSAGVAADLIAPCLARRAGSVALDFGHLADELIAGRRSL